MIIPRPTTRRRSTQGNTLTEYAMIGTGVLCLTIGMIYILGSNLNQAFGGTKNNMQNTISNANSVNSAQAAAVANANANALADQIGQALLDGANNAATVQVTASNGSTATGLIGQTIQYGFNIAPQDMNSDQIQALERMMSNQTFSIADLEKQMDDILKYAASDPSKFMNTTLNFEGKTQPAITLAIGLQNEAQMLASMKAQLDGSNASDADKAKLDALVTKISGEAAAIYSQSQALQSQYNAQIAAAAAAAAAQAQAEANSTSDSGTKAEKQAEADSAAATASAAQGVASATASAADSAAQTAADSGVSPTQSASSAANTSTQSAGVMCKTGDGLTGADHCSPNYY